MTKLKYVVLQNSFYVKVGTNLYKEYGTGRQVEAKDLKIFTETDDLEEALSLIHCRFCGNAMTCHEEGIIACEDDDDSDYVKMKNFAEDD